MEKEFRCNGKWIKLSADFAFEFSTCNLNSCVKLAELSIVETLKTHSRNSLLVFTTISKVNVLSEGKTGRLYTYFYILPGFLLAQRGNSKDFSHGIIFEF